MFNTEQVNDFVKEKKLYFETFMDVLFLEVCILLKIKIAFY